MNKTIEENEVRREVHSPDERTHQTITRTYSGAVAPTERTYAKKKVVFRADQIIWFISGLIETLLVFRFVLKLLGANFSGFTVSIYDFSYPLVAPFVGTFNVHYLGNSVFEWTTLLAMAVYYLLALGINKAFRFYKPADPAEVDQKTDSI